MSGENNLAYSTANECQLRLRQLTLNLKILRRRFDRCQFISIVFHFDGSPSEILRKENTPTPSGEHHFADTSANQRQLEFAQLDELRLGFTNGHLDCADFIQILFHVPPSG